MDRNNRFRPEMVLRLPAPFSRRGLAARLRCIDLLKSHAMTRKYAARSRRLNGTHRLNLCTDASDDAATCHRQAGTPARREVDHASGMGRGNRRRTGTCSPPPRKALATRRLKAGNRQLPQPSHGAPDIAPTHPAARRPPPIRPMPRLRLRPPRHHRPLP